MSDIVSIYALQQSEYFYYFYLTQYMQFGIELIILTILTSLLSLVLHLSEMKQSLNYFKQIVQGRFFNFDLNEFILHFQSSYLNIEAKFKRSVLDN